MTTTFSTPLFWTAALVLIALAWTLLWRSQGRSEARPGAGTAVALLDEQLRATDAEFAAGAIDAARHAEVQVELQRRLLAEAPSAVTSTVAIEAAGSATSRPSGTLIGLALALPVAAFAGYFALGNLAALSVAPIVAAAGPDVSPEEVQAMVDTLAQRMQQQPAGRAEDLPGWVMLGRSYAALQRFDDAGKALEHAVELAPNDASLLADLADVLAMAQARDARGTMSTERPSTASERITQLLTHALELDPDNLKALALAGNAAFERHDTTVAVDFWRRARALAPAGSDFAAGLDQNLVDAGAASTGATASIGGATPVLVSGTSIRGQVRIAPALAARVAPGDTVFIFARAVNGPPMPLAILRRTAADLPIDFTLDDSLAMSPEWKISKAGKVTVGARVSRSGDAMPRSGDLTGQVDAVAGDSGLAITIDAVAP